MRIVLYLDVADAKDVGGIDVGAREPRLHFFERSDGIGGPAGEIKRKAKQLNSFAVVRIFLASLLQIRDRVQVIALLVVSRPEFMRESRRRGMLSLEFMERGKRVVVLSLLQETMNLLEF